jgi:hypothetical protein
MLLCSFFAEYALPTTLDMEKAKEYDDGCA